MSKQPKLKKKLLFSGESSLSDHELLAVALGDWRVATLLLKRHASSLRKIHQTPASELQHILSLGQERIIQLKAFAEIHRRIHMENLQAGKQLNHAQAVFEAVWPLVSHEHREVFLLLPLDTKNRLLCAPIVVSVGSSTGTIVHPRQIAEYIISYRANACICAHNHPSGVCDPSQDDIDLTKRLHELTHLLGVPMLDALIVGNGHYYSFQEHGVMNRWICG